MTSKQFVVPELHDLFKWHLYIGYCESDKESVRGLYRVVHTLELTCSQRSSIDAAELSTKQNVEDGINFSQICLLYVSPTYINDCLSIYELQEAKRKVKYFGKRSVLAIIEPSVDKSHLEKFSEFTMIHRERDQQIFTETDVKEFLSGFELKPTLSTLPKSNIGVGVALTYFYGFLQLLLPGFTNNLRKAFGQDDVDWNYVAKKMLIIIPESVNSPPKLTEPGSLEQTNWIVKQFACRSGREGREYTVPVFRLTPVDGQESYYFVGDIPACLYALREAYDCGSAGMSKSELYQARNEFCFTLQGLLNHPDNLAKCANQWEMLVWPDTEENPNRKKLSEFLNQQFKTKQLTEVVPVELDGPVQATSDNPTFIRQKGIQNSTAYRGIEKYQLKRNQRGCCVIINNSRFPNINLENRTGDGVENANLKDLFTQLHFEVELHENLSAIEMKTCLESYQRRDHSMHDAFVCCILSHGMCGSVCATDGSLVKILPLMELFYVNACPSLQGKPKLFFIGACQTEGPGSSGVQETGTKLLANASPDVVDQTTHNLVPSEKDFFVSYAALPKQVAYAHPEYGGLYVQALCKILKEDNEIELALKKVCSEVSTNLKYYSERYNEDYADQKPFHMCITDKSLFLCADIL